MFFQKLQKITLSNYIYLMQKKMFIVARKLLYGVLLLPCSYAALKVWVWGPLQ
jgi:hypothetical protein